MKKPSNRTARRWIMAKIEAIRESAAFGASHAALRNAESVRAYLRRVLPDPKIKRLQRSINP